MSHKKSQFPQTFEVVLLSNSAQEVRNQIRCLSANRWEFCEDYQVPNDQTAALVGSLVRWLVKFPDEQQVKVGVAGMEISIVRAKGSED